MVWKEKGEFIRENRVKSLQQLIFLMKDEDAAGLSEYLSSNLQEQASLPKVNPEISSDEMRPWHWCIEINNPEVATSIRKAITMADNFLEI